MLLLSPFLYSVFLEVNSSEPSWKEFSYLLISLDLALSEKPLILLYYIDLSYSSSYLKLYFKLDDEPFYLFILLNILS